MGREQAEGLGAVRVDKWLWAARFYKSRSIAVTAIEGGKVTVNGERVKPSRDIKPGDSVRIRLGPYEHVIIVRALSDRRGPAAQAASLFDETADSRAAREKLHWQLKHAAPVIVAGEGRPTKKDRRDLNRLKGH
ncbi:MAG: RNA-binding S4 domain-containing protein [Gemmatimonadaceae bacterium]